MEKYGMGFKEMTRKEKVNHIWEYYRWHIISTIIAVVVVFSLGKAMLFPVPPNTVDIVVAAQMYTSLNYSEVTQQFKEEYDTGLDLTSVNWDDPQTAFIMLQKFPLLITTQELDIMGLSVGQFDSFMQVYGTDMFTPLETLPELQGLLERYEDNLVTCNILKDEDGNEIITQEHVYGIRVDKLSNVPCIEANETIVLGLSSTVKDMDKTIEMLKYILE